ncbi:MAG: hypothetical protein RIS20_737 [Bacteroidota bacterium]
MIQRHQYKLILLGLTVVFLAWELPTLLFHPNEYLLTADGDGLKSYYSFVYHLTFDSTLFHFGGMNYPHGEHYLYTDGFPAIAWLIQLLPFLKPYGIFIIHFTLIISLLFTPLFIYLILRKFHVHQWIAIFGALSLFILQPQFPRLFSHLSLAYSIFFPLSWYLLLRFKEQHSSLKWIGLLIINQLFWYFMHPYLGFMVTVFYGIDWVIEQVKKGTLFRQRLITFVPVILPVLLVQLLLKLTDSIGDRPTTPYGFFEYQAHWKSIFLPDSGPIHDWIAHYISFGEFRWEGYAYIGFLSILLLLFGVGFLIWSVLNKSKKKTEFPPQWIPALLAAFFLLILSFGFPFNGNPHWLDYLTFLKQFRALGRFSWVFYYVIGVLGIYLLNILYDRFRGLEIKHRFQHKTLILILLLLCLQIKEGLSLLKIPEHFEKNIFDWKHLSSAEKQLIRSADKIKPEVKAILPLPWFHIGSEIYGKEANPSTLRNSFLLSAHTGIPIYAVMLGRTSKQQTIDYFHFFLCSQHTSKSSYLPLLIYHNPSVGLYGEDEQKLLSDANQLNANSIGELLILKKNQIQKDLSLHSSTILREEFSDEEKWNGQVVNGRYRGKIENYNTIISLDSSKIEPNEWYEISFDYYPDWTKPLSNVCYIEFVNPKTKEVNWFYVRSVGSFPGIYSNKIHANIRFKSQTFPCEYHCFLFGKSTNVFFEVDHIKVRKIKL